MRTPLHSLATLTAAAVTSAITMTVLASGALAAPVPDPLDFAAITPEDSQYLMPAAADRFKNTDGSYTIGRPHAGGPGAGVTLPALHEFYSQKIANLLPQMARVTPVRESNVATSSCP